MARIFNSHNSYSQTIGNTLPFLWDVPPMRMPKGFKVANTIDAGTRIPAGTPMAIDLQNRTAKFLRFWKVEKVTADAEAGTTEIDLTKDVFAPVLKASDYIMVLPSTLSGTGKAVLAGAVTEGTSKYTITVTTANFDTVAVGDYIVESAATAAGSAKAVYCEPNTVNFEDCVIGTEETFVEAAASQINAYKNCCRTMPSIVETSVSEANLMPRIQWDYFNTNH